MIIRIQFVQKDTKSISYSWSLFSVEEIWNLQDIFIKIKACGCGIDLVLYDDNQGLIEKNNLGNC